MPTRWTPRQRPHNLARPWRVAADQGDIYRSRRVEDPRSRDQTLI